MSFAIEPRALAKRNRTARGEPPLRVVDGINFTMRLGEVFGLLGPNGVKTPTIFMLTGLANPTSGSARVPEFDLLRETARIKTQIGVVPEQDAAAIARDG